MAGCQGEEGARGGHQSEHVQGEDRCRTNHDVTTLGADLDPLESVWVSPIPRLAETSRLVEEGRGEVGVAVMVLEPPQSRSDWQL